MGDRLRDREPEPRARARLGRAAAVEAVEQVRQFLIRDARPLVGDAQPHAFVLVAQRQPDRAARRRHAEGVVDQVAEQLREPVAVANNDRLYADLERAAGACGERLWRMPLDAEYAEQIKSDVADIKNTGGRPAGSITAAKFLERFAGATPWAHLDIAGVMDADRDRGVLVKGASGTPVRTLVHFVLGRAREAGGGR